ncbi:MAG: hypothetical protein JWP74_1717 [Marmoricola sp.]|nr:hypothetical protein [Marmoricola sp.]
MSPLVRTPTSRLTYLTLDDLEEILWEFRDQGASIFAAEGPSGPEWQLRVKMHGAETTFRAHRAIPLDVVA